MFPTFAVAESVPAISLSETNYTFPEAVVGYGSQTAKTVRITNNGNAATGTLSITLSGDKPSSFRLSKSSQTTLAAGRSATFTVVPNTRLEAGIHAATVSVRNANVPVQTVNVSFTVNPTIRKISLSETGMYTFQSAYESYGSQSAKTVTITNHGNVATGTLTIALSGSNKGSFTLSKTLITSLAVGKTNSFTVVPKTGLVPGAYTAKVTVANANASASFDIGFTVSRTIKIACVGDSITYGYGVSARDSYPSQLQRKLGAGYTVLNFGVVSATANGKGNLPYIRQSAYQRALKSNPDIVIFMLGTNDAKAVNRTSMLSAIFKAEYRNLVQTFVNLPTQPTVYIVTPIGSITSTGSNATAEPIMASQIRPEIREVASELNLTIIEFESILKNVKSHYLPDGRHPSKSGYDIMSSVFYNYITK
jgi:lysophospholipase L1-like esterase/methionine-rich copper-binding protein CopC